MYRYYECDGLTWLFNFHHSQNNKRARNRFLFRIAMNLKLQHERIEFLKCGVYSTDNNSLERVKCKSSIESNRDLLHTFEIDMTKRCFHSLFFCVIDFVTYHSYSIAKSFIGFSKS